ncbi:DUF1330 domain-containing protein [Emticicia sp. BO119]|uniref:DUF1330 domain-containing protein n=1 Tax=Emticicia sp. BO119 TaxID=2757768 RepID=UPI0015F08B24|nr:DUF1330 domain-containing protein [Emticicia sp. BO119]MBA4850614.1 DUF1330 domain-containing protein [Emticicia sp. BO119]
MIYITQLIFVKEGKEAVFHEFEDNVLPLIEKFNGKLLYRVRPDNPAYIVAEGEKPYEIHFVTFESESDLQAYMKDDGRLKFIHLKNDSVQSMLLVKGNKM